MNQRKPYPEITSSVTISFKPHEQRELVNALRDIAVTHGQTQHIRDTIARAINDFVHRHKGQ